MRDRLVSSILTVAALLACSLVVLAQTVEKPKVAKTQMAAPATDLTGVWRRSRRPPDKARKYTIYELAFLITNEKPPMTPWAEAKFKTAKPNVGPNAVTLTETNDPISNCFPPGVPRIYTHPFPVQILQTQEQVAMLFEYDSMRRHIYIDGRPHDTSLGPSWMGDSIGHWEGDTLVVDTVNFNDKTWLDRVGHPHSDALHLTERFRRAKDHLFDDITIEDPKAYTKSWGVKYVYKLKPWDIGEEICTLSSEKNFDRGIVNPASATPPGK